jgi:transposase
MSRRRWWSSQCWPTAWSCGCGRMFFPAGQVRVWLHTRSTDMRKSFNGLSALVKHTLGEDPVSGHLFVFVNRNQTYVKVLYFDRSGYCLWAKRLVRGRFQYRQTENGKVELDATRLKLLLEGTNVKEVCLHKRYRRVPHTAA